MLREAAGLMPAVNQLAVDLYVEDPAAAPDQLDLDRVLLLDCVRQTGGCRFVVSLSAVLDADFHW
jgi:hypothetical protein